jgi:hypothetical protein
MVCPGDLGDTPILCRPMETHAKRRCADPSEAALWQGLVLASANRNASRRDGIEVRHMD